MRSLREWLKREWAEWREAWREIRDERYPRHYEDRFVAVPFVRHCELLQAEQRLLQAEERGKMMAFRLAVSMEQRMRLEGELARERRLSETLGAIVFQMECEAGPQNVARLELVAPSRKGFDS